MHCDAELQFVPDETVVGGKNIPDTSEATNISHCLRTLVCIFSEKLTNLDESISNIINYLLEINV